jgi:tetratricopeptide (TPR) repeat protein
LRVVGEAQFQAGDLRYAAETWEQMRAEFPNDLQANLRLGTIYLKLGDLVRSDEALKKVIAAKGLDSQDLAEARALSSSTAKTRWLRDFSGRESLDERQAEALRSSFLIDSLEQYLKGFETDPGHYYSGLNALAMTHHPYRIGRSATIRLARAV